MTTRPLIPVDREEVASLRDHIKALEARLNILQNAVDEDVYSLMREANALARAADHERRITALERLSGANVIIPFGDI